MNAARARTTRRSRGEGTTITGLVAVVGDEWPCTFTNTRKSGHVKLVKDIVPVDEQLGDPGKFDLNIDGEGAYDATKSDAGDGDSVELTVPNGNVDLAEAAGTGTSLGDYTSSYSCTAEGHDAVTGSGTSIDDLLVAAGDDWTCVLRNERKPGTVTVAKVIIAIDQQLGDPGKFDLNIDGEGGYDKTHENAVNGGSTSLVVPGGPVAFSEARATTPTCPTTRRPTSASTRPRATRTHRSAARAPTSRRCRSSRATSGPARSRTRARAVT